jgi:hypothetical protein
MAAQTMLFVLEMLLVLHMSMPSSSHPSSSLEEVRRVPSFHRPLLPT